MKRLPYILDARCLKVKRKTELSVSENRVLGNLFGPKSDEVPAEWRRFRNEELHYLYCYPNIIRFIVSRRIRWAGHVACMVAKKRCVQNFVMDGRRKESNTNAWA